ncbi:MAG TPA: ankyrin repeat domain-containing protein [Tepidisphaeraceae bacterium]
MDDAQILQHYLDGHAPADTFAQWVAGRVPLVYSAALRQLRDPVLADQATQAVFVLLLRRTPPLGPISNLTPWLFDTTRRVCRQLGGGSVPGAPTDGVAPPAIYAAPSDWAGLSTGIDEAIALLADDPRRAFLLKYLANLPVRDVAEALGWSDAVNAAGQEISAAVVRLRQYFESRNRFVAPDALIAAIQAHAVQPAPAAVVQNAITAAIAGAPAPVAALADRVAAAVRRGRIARAAAVVGVLFLIGVTGVMLYGAMKNARLAATRPSADSAADAATGNSASNSASSNVPAAPPGNPPALPQQPMPPPAPVKPLPLTKPEKPIDSQQAARFLAAIRHGDADTVRGMVDQEEAIVNVKDPQTGRSAVEVAAEAVQWRRQDATRIAHLLIDNGAATSIFTAARAGHRDYVAAMLNEQPQLLFAKDQEGLTALQRAALVPGPSPECEEVVDLLIQCGAKVDIWTACTFARFEDVKQALADDPKLINQRCLGGTPLSWAVRPRRYPDDPLAIPRLLLEQGADPRSVDTASEGRMTPLHHAAAWGGQAAVAQLLLDHGVEVNISDDFGWTPLDYAIARGRKEMVEFLQSKGGRRTTVDQPDQPSKTARFFAAVQDGDVDLVHRLLDDTPELAKTRGATGETPLHWAAAGGSDAIIDLLLADRADVNAQESNKFGGTPLHWAVRHDRLGTVKHLLERGGDARALNQRNGQTLVHTAAQHTDDAALVELLLSKGIDPGVKDRFGKTAAEYAREAGHGAVAGRLGK